MTDIAFRAVDADADFETCRRFTEDAYLCSYGSVERMEPPGFDWEAWFKSEVAAFPTGWMLVSQDSAVVGLIALAISDAEHTGHAYLMYLIPEARGTGVSTALHEFALQTFKQSGMARATLNVSPTNARAVAFYRKHGWTDAGPRPGHEYVHLMELQVHRGSRAGA